MRLGVPDIQRGGTGGLDAPQVGTELAYSPSWYKVLAQPVEYRNNDTEIVVVVTMTFGGMVIDMFF